MGALWPRHEIVRNPALLLVPPDAVVRIRRAAVDVDRRARVEASDHMGLEAGSLADIGAIGRQMNRGVMTDERTQLSR